MAARTPIVCSDLPGFRAVASGTAVLVTPDNAGLLADALRRVVSDKALADRMSTVGARTASAFDWPRLVGNVENIYDRAIEERVNV